jgi:hypothetical protein
LAAKLPGRGAWVEASRDGLAKALKRDAFARALQAKAIAPPDLAERVEAGLAQRCLDQLGLAKRSGAIAAGTRQVEEAIRRAQPYYLIEASDGAAQGREDMKRLAFGLWGEEPHVIGCFSSAEMGMALGRDPVVHAILLHEGMARRWAIEVDRLAGFRAITPASWPTGGDRRRSAADGA